MTFIRPAILHDAAAIAQVRVDSWRTTYAGLIPDDYLAQLSYAQYTLNWKILLTPNAGPNYTWVAEDAGQIVGFCIGGLNRDLDPDYQAELYAVYLLQNHQRQGLGQRLVAALVEALLEQDMHSMNVWVLADNPARRFYERLGGEYITKRDSLLGKMTLKEVSYGWRSLPQLLQRLEARLPRQ